MYAAKVDWKEIFEAQGRKNKKCQEDSWKIEILMQLWREGISLTRVIR